jgi:hypothetical membrane protein
MEFIKSLPDSFQGPGGKKIRMTPSIIVSMKIQRGSLFRPETNYYKAAGIILMTACLQFLLAVMIAETQYKFYSTSMNTLSDLGAVAGYSATIFNLSVMILGVLGLLVVYLVLKSGGCRLFSSSLAIASLAAVGVGLFPTYTGTPHTLFSGLVFVFGSLAVIFSYRLGLNVPMVGLSFILGILSLVTIISFLWLGIESPLVVILGVGGAERLVAYPVLLYLVGLGGYLNSRGEDWVRLRFHTLFK